MLGEWVGAGIWTVGSPAEFRRFGGLLDAGGRISEPFPSVSEYESEPFSPKTKRRTLKKLFQRNTSRRSSY